VVGDLAVFDSEYVDAGAAWSLVATWVIINTRAFFEGLSMPKLFRRIVTGHNDSGQAVIQSDAPPERIKVAGKDGPTFYEVWNTRDTPAPIDRGSGEPPEEQLTLVPPPKGTRIRVLDFPAETPDMQRIDASAAREHFAAMGAADALTHNRDNSRHPFMHRTETIDYGIVLEGEITLLVDDGETTVRAGDIVIQRGTNHSWVNRSGQNCRVAFILIDGKFTDGL
jgi:mannose-6-phosphate isomerase-like protein (cupin superfamily)